MALRTPNSVSAKGIAMDGAIAPAYSDAGFMRLTAARITRCLARTLPSMLSRLGSGTPRLHVFAVAPAKVAMFAMPRGTTVSTN